MDGRQSSGKTCRWEWRLWRERYFFETSLRCKSFLFGFSVTIIVDISVGRLSAHCSWSTLVYCVKWIISSVNLQCVWINFFGFIFLQECGCNLNFRLRFTIYPYYSVRAGTILFKFLCFMWEFHCRQIIENSAILFDYWKDWLCWLVLWLVSRQTTVKDAYCGVILLESGMFKEDAWNDIIINKSSWKEITNNKMPVIWTRLIWIPHYFKLKTISLSFTLRSCTIVSFIILVSSSIVKRFRTFV